MLQNEQTLQFADLGSVQQNKQGVQTVFSHATFDIWLTTRLHKLQDPVTVMIAHPALIRHAEKSILTNLSRQCRVDDLLTLCRWYSSSSLCKGVGNFTFMALCSSSDPAYVFNSCGSIILQAYTHELRKLVDVPLFSSMSSGLAESYVAKKWPSLSEA